MNERIKKLRRSLDLTQQEFADRIGVKRNTIANYEIGRNEPIDSVLELIVREFGVSKQWLLDGTGEMFFPAPTNGLDLLAQEKALTHGEYILIEKFVNLKPETRQNILDYIQEVAAALSAGDVPADAPAIDCRESAESLHAELDRQLGIEKKKKRRAGPKPLDLEAAAQKENMERLRVSPVKPKKKKGRAVCVGSSPFL